MRVNQQKNFSLKVLAASAVLVITGITAYAGDLNVAGNTVSVSSGGLGVTPLAIDANGIVATIALPASAVNGGAAAPNFTYTLESSMDTADGVYTFRAGFVIDDDNSARRLEISIPSLSMSFTGGVLTGSVPAGGSVTVLGRAADNTTELSTTIGNALFAFNGASLSFNAGNQITDITAAGGILGDIATTIGAEGGYSYAVVLKQTAGPVGESLIFGRSGPFTALGCAPASTFELGGGQFSSSYTGGFGLQGQFTVIGGGGIGAAPTPFANACTPIITAAGGGGGGDEEEEEPIECPDGYIEDTLDGECILDPESSADEQGQAISDLINTIDTNDVDDSTVTATEQVLSGTSTLSETLSTGIADGSVSTGGALDGANTVKDALDLTGAVIQGGGEVDQTAINNSLSGITDIFDALETSSSSLTSFQIDSVQSTTESTLDAITNVFTSTTTVSQTEDLIGNIGDVINSAINLGASLDTDLISSAQTLTQTALENTLSDIAKALDSSLSVTFTDVTSTQTLLRSNTALLSSVLDTISIRLTSSLQLDQTSTASTLMSSGLSSTDASSLATNLAQFVNPTGISQNHRKWRYYQRCGFN